MPGTRVENIINNATFSATVTSGPIQNDGRAVWAVDTITGAVTTSPTLAITVNVSVDKTNWVSAGTGATLSTQTSQRLTFGQGGTGSAPNFQAITEPWIEVVATFGGSGNFANTIVNLVGIGQFD